MRQGQPPSRLATAALTVAALALAVTLVALIAAVVTLSDDSEGSAADSRAEQNDVTPFVPDASAPTETSVSLSEEVVTFSRRARDVVTDRR